VVIILALALTVAAVEGRRRVHRMNRDVPVPAAAAMPATPNSVPAAAVVVEQQQPTLTAVQQSVPVVPPSAPPQSGQPGKKSLEKKTQVPKRVTEPGQLPPIKPKSTDREELIKFIRANSPKLLESKLKMIQIYLNGQMLWTFEDLVKLGPEGVKALQVPAAVRAQFTDLLIAHIAKTRPGVDDGLIVYVPLYKKPVPIDYCPDPDDSFSLHRFASGITPETSVGDWLRRMYPGIKPIKMTRAIQDLKRQTIVTFADLNRVGVAGVAKLLYVPKGMREALHEAVLWHLGVSDGYDNQLLEPYIEMKKPGDGLIPAIAIQPKKTKCQIERARKAQDKADKAQARKEALARS